jgi:hypothetical protein
MPAWLLSCQQRRRQQTRALACASAGRWAVPLVAVLRKARPTLSLCCLAACCRVRLSCGPGTPLPAPLSRCLRPTLSQTFLLPSMNIGRFATEAHAQLVHTLFQLSRACWTRAVLEQRTCLPLTTWISDVTTLLPSSRKLLALSPQPAARTAASNSRRVAAPFHVLHITAVLPPLLQASH